MPYYPIKKRSEMLGTFQKFVQAACLCVQRERGDLNSISTSEMAFLWNHLNKLLQSFENQKASNILLHRNLLWESLLPVQPTYSAKAMNSLRFYSNIAGTGSQMNILLFLLNPLKILVKGQLLFHIHLPDPWKEVLLLNSILRKLQRSLKL